MFKKVVTFGLLGYSSLLLASTSVIDNDGNTFEIVQNRVIEIMKDSSDWVPLKAPDQAQDNCYMPNSLAINNNNIYIASRTSCFIFQQDSYNYHYFLTSLYVYNNYGQIRSSQVQPLTFEYDWSSGDDYYVDQMTTSGNMIVLSGTMVGVHHEDRPITSSYNITTGAWILGTSTK